MIKKTKKYNKNDIELNKVFVIDVYIFSCWILFFSYLFKKKR